jgi:N-hydroxyarylamine O-acetyltransferase
MVNLPAYLARIGYSGATEVSAETLRALHRAHMFAVPFENLDIYLGRTIVCDEARFLDKIVNQQRGGFCYELNGAFAALLRALGFQVTLLSARVASSDGSDGPEFDHLTLRVGLPSHGSNADPGAPQQSHESEEPWLADVGFGDSFIEPLRLQPDLEQPQFGRIYRLSENHGDFHMEVMADGEWKKQYSFTLRPHRLSDFAAMCHYQQTSPESHFTRQRICSRATPEGRITLSDLKLIETRDGRREERALPGEPQWRTTLRELFGVDLPA